MKKQIKKQTKNLTSVVIINDDAKKKELKLINETVKDIHNFFNNLG